MFVSIFADVTATDDPLVAFKNCHVAVLVGAMPRREGMERKDLLKANAGIFKIQGQALDQVGNKNVKVNLILRNCSFSFFFLNNNNLRSWWLEILLTLTLT